MASSEIAARLRPTRLAQSKAIAILIAPATSEIQMRTSTQSTAGKLKIAAAEIYKRFSTGRSQIGELSHAQIIELGKSYTSSERAKEDSVREAYKPHEMRR